MAWPFPFQTCLPKERLCPASNNAYNSTMSKTSNPSQQEPDSEVNKWQMLLHCKQSGARTAPTKMKISCEMRCSFSSSCSKSQSQAKQVMRARVSATSRTSIQEACEAPPCDAVVVSGTSMHNISQYSNMRESRKFLQAQEREEPFCNRKPEHLTGNSYVMQLLEGIRSPNAVKAG